MAERFWSPIATAPHNRYVYLRGPSGYTGTPYRVMVAKHTADFRPLQPWITYAGDSVLEDGEMPTHWMPIIDDERE